METGTISELDIERNVGRIATATDFLQFNSDNVIIGALHQMQIGQQIWFEREQAHGPRPTGLQVRTIEPVARELDRLEITADAIGLDKA